ncbi:MAG: glycosyltransferase family 4 protein [Anaerolineae bacterium]|nr:glycosyltransferase family 4 protein [Anaerolineae bacterium]
MRVVHLIKMTRIAGAERHLLDLVGGLRARGVDAHFLLLVEPGNLMLDFVAEAAARDVPCECVTIAHNADVTLYPRLWRRLRALRPDVAHTHLQHADLYGIPAARLAGVPVVITSRHNDNRFRRWFPIRQLNWLLWRWVSAGIGISENMRRFAITVEGAPADRVHTIFYGLDPDVQPVEKATARAAIRQEFGLGPDAPLLGMVCRLIEQKGVPYALEAFARLTERFPDAHLLLAGEGELQERLAAQARLMDGGERVHFLGWREDIPQVMAALDVFLMPSLWEGFGLVLLEAMAQGLPVVGSAVSAIPEIVVEGETGLLCPPMDAVTLAACIARVLDDADLRQRLGAAGRARLEATFTVDRMVDATLALYDQTLAKANRQDAKDAKKGN